MDTTRTEGEPHDRLTRICDRMTTTFEMHPEHQPRDKCIVFLDDGERGGLVLHGYDDDTEAMVNLLMHLRALFRANGKDLEIIAVPNDASGLTER
jgi:hypothetical protein